MQPGETKTISESELEATREIEARLGHAFADAGLLDEALTHRSFRNEHPGSCAHNERLEFLGDAVLGMIVAESLMRLAPGASEGQLTQMRASLVNAESLTKVAADLGIGGALRLGRGEERNNGREKASILADAVEAIVGAVFLDAGFEAAHSAVNRLLGDAIESVAAGEILQDAKTVLQEKMQAFGAGTPWYRVVGTSGPEHLKTFEVEIVLGEKVIARGRGRSKKEAEKDAALCALQTVGEGDGT